MGEQSYDYQNTKRDLSDVISVVSAAEPALISLVGMGGEAATHTKHEWMEDYIAAERDELNGAILVDAVSITVVDGSKFDAGMQIAFEGYDEVMTVTNVAGNDLTVTRGYGGSTATAMADGTEILIVSRPRPESTPAGDDSSRRPVTEYNYTEIFDHTAAVSKTAEAVKQYGISSALDFAVQAGVVNLTRRMNNTMVYGRRVQRSSTEPGSMGGILQYIDQPGGNVLDGAATAFEEDMLNDLLEAVVRAGGRPNALMVNTGVARKMASWYKDRLVIVREDTTVGRSVGEFRSDLPGGVITKIVVDINFPKYKISALDTTRIRLVPLNQRALTDEDATPRGADFYARRVLGEYTMEMKNALQAHGLLKNFTL